MLDTVFVSAVDVEHDCKALFMLMENRNEQYKFTPILGTLWLSPLFGISSLSLSHSLILLWNKPTFILQWRG